MKNLIAILAFLMMGQAYAQSVQYAQPGGTLPTAKKKAVIYDERTNELVEVQPQVQAQVVPAQVVESAPIASSAPAPIYILNNQKYQGYQGGATAQSQQIHEQPLTVVQDTPLTGSAADGMRRKRQDVEAATEDGIVQALEKARMEDEIRRREKFNNAIGTGAGDASTVVTPVAPTYQQVQPAPQPVVQQVVPQTVVVEKEADKEEEKVDIRSEIREALREAQPEAESEPRYYVSGQVGMSKYPDVINVRGNVSTGFSVGVVTAERVVAEGSFIYSGYEMEDVRTSSTYYPRIVDMKQYNVDAALKFQPLSGRFRPAIGGVVSYARRNFSEGGYGYRNSDAFDIGVVAGADLQVTKSFALGVDFRYLTNVAYRDSKNSPASFVYPQIGGDTPIEKLDYYTGALVGKFTF